MTMLSTKGGDEWLTAEEAAERLDCSRRSLFLMDKTGLKYKHKVDEDGNDLFWVPSEESLDRNAYVTPGGQRFRNIDDYAEACKKEERERRTSNIVYRP